MRYIILLLILLSGFILNPRLIYSESFNGFEVLQQTNNSITIQFISNFTDFGIITDIDGNEFHAPEIENSRMQFEPGNYFPVFLSPVNLIVPAPNAYSYSIIHKIEREFQNIRLSPLPKYLVDNNRNLSELFDEFQIMATNEVNLDYAGISRGQHISGLTIHPVKYNKAEKSLKIIDTIVIKIDFDISQANIINNYNDFSALSTINYAQGKFWSADKDRKRLDTYEFLSDKQIAISELSNGKWGRITIADEGVYRLDASDLQSIGIPATAEAARTIKIFGKGGKPLSELVSAGLNNQMDEQEIIVRTRNDGSLESVIFYANSTNGFERRNGEFSHYKNFYSDKNYYLITWGGTNGKRAEGIPNPDGEILFKPTNYIERVFVDEDIVNAHNLGGGRDWFGRSFFSSPMSPVMLHDLERGGEISYKFAMAHRASSVGSFTIFENNQQIGILSLNSDRSDPYVSSVRNFLNVKIPASQIAGDNRSIIRFQYQNSQVTAVGYFDYYEMSYPRRFFAVNNQIRFIPDPDMHGIAEFNINGFSGEIFGFDVSDEKNPKLLTNKSVTGSIYSFCYNLSMIKFSRFFISSNLRKPAVETIEIANLRDNNDNAEIVVITHPLLLESAIKFKNYRANQSGKKVEVYRTDHIYNEFSSSIPDPTALRDFLINIYNRWETKPKYLVIWGDGHYDFRNIATNQVNYIPAYQTYRNDISEFNDIHEGYATDDFYALIDGDDLLVDINFGRVTIDNPETGNWVADKIIHYETSQSDDIWRTNMIYIADDGPSEGTKYDGSTHSGQSENLQTNFVSRNNPDLQFEKIYLVEYPTIYVGSGRAKPAVTEEMLTRINTTGGLILNWIGHGNPRVWAHERILDRDITIPQMRNIDKLFFLTAATCDYARFDDPNVRSGAEEMFISRNGAAIGVFSASRIVYSDDNARLTYAFYNRLMSRNPETGKFPTLGEVINAVKQTFYFTNDRKFFLLGDPTMTLLMPEYKVNISSVNQQELGGQILNLEALSKVTVKGYVSKPGTNEIDNSYNGTVVVTLRDGDVVMRVQEYHQGVPRSMFVYRKLGGSLNRSSYIVQNGEFEAEFIIPKDISFSDSLGRLFMYSASNDGRYASGSYHNIMINGFSDVDILDTIPPDISIYLDGRKFKSGDVVTVNPRLIVDLFDESGINTTGLGIGHRIEAWIDDSPVSIDLTDKFSSSLTDSRRGTVEDILFGLSPGKHKIRVRAWDVFNNFSIAEVFFVIPENNGGLVENIYNYPNPFTDGTNIVFRHNAVAPYDVNLEIYTINGVLIRNIENTLNSLHTSEIFWDGKDSGGNRIADGIYLVNVRIIHDSGLTLGRGKLIKIAN
ncbi:MAG: type IX secretion system sortase PorU [Candidatus Kapabacteria bacterium]|nr:type IX secretion system sortase PorU [Ignavibacteriota bacterium]MCW5886054.1 type IX secretion system sortase PorU [Candidatus Kapabacteria bacterium]